MSNPLTANFAIVPNGDDARFIAGFDTHAEAEAAALARSGHSLGIALYGPSGIIAAYKDGTCIGFLDPDTRKWVGDFN
jgi:hypothetical protein